jgi:hypothetical protein
MIEIQNHRWEMPSRILIYLIALSGSLILIYSILWIDIARLSDYENYLLWAMEFQEKSWEEIGFIEFFSFAQIKFFGSLGNSVDMGLQNLYILNTIIAAIGLFGLSVRYGKTVSGVILVYVLYGPLLSYITLRATPAYLLVSWFILIRKGVIFKLLLIAMAFLYHVTAIIPAFLVAGVSALKLNVRFDLKNKKSRLRLLINSILFLGICAELMWNLGLGDDIARFVAGLTAATDKFQEYLETASFYRSKAHFGYFVFVLVTTCFYLHLTSSFGNDFWWVILAALVTFIFLSISPVAAYRFSIFFLNLYLAGSGCCSGCKIVYGLSLCHISYFI